MSMDADVIIVGAGAAGLAAALDLSDAGLKTLALEARERVGGRVYTLREAARPLPIELGAEFIHGLSPEVWNIVRAAGLRADEVAGAAWCEGQNHRLAPCPDSDDARGEEVWKRVRAFSSADQTFADFLAVCCADPELTEDREAA